MVRTQEEAEDKPLSPVTGVIGVTDLPQGVVEWCPTGLLQHLKLQDHPLKEEEDFNHLVKVGGKLVETTHHLQEVLINFLQLAQVMEVMRTVLFVPVGSLQCC